MRPGQNQRRPQRGRGGRSGGSVGGGSRQMGGGAPLRHHVFDSNGPSVKVRGNAFQIHEKYLSLARDAASSGDHIQAENFFQHAEHYQRIMMLITENEQARQQHFRPDDRENRGYQPPQEATPPPDNSEPPATASFEDQNQSQDDR